MSVDSTVAYSGPYTTNGATTVFPFSFRALTAGEVSVLLRDASTGVEQIVNPSEYSVTLIESGGSVTFAVAPLPGSVLYVQSDPLFSQGIEFSDGDRWSSAPVNEANDRAAIRDLHLKSGVDRAIKVPIGQESLPANFDGAVDGTVLAVISGTIVPIENTTAAVEQNVVDSQTAALSAVISAAHTAEDRIQTGIDVISAGNSATSAQGYAAGASISAVTAGLYPNAAATNVPRGLTQASVGAITPGSGGTNGTFALAWSSGNFSINPTGTFTVAGGVLTAVTITGPGLYIGASPTVPTPSFAASTGLTGAAVALTAQFLIASGQGYFAQSADTKTYNRYYNASGAATADAGVQPIPANPSLASVISQLSETVRDTFGVADPITGSASTGARWAFLNTTAAHDVLIDKIVASVTATGAQKLEISYPPSPTNRTQAAPDVVVTPTTTGLQTLVAPTHFTAFTMPAGSQAGQFGNWIGYALSATGDAALCGGVDADTVYSQSAASLVAFQIRLSGTRSSSIALESRLDALDAGVTYDQNTITHIGASDATRSGAAATSPSTATWTMSTVLPVTAPVDQVFFDAKTTGTAKVRLMRSGSQVGADVSITVSATGPQTATVNLVDARAGDKIRFTGITFGYSTPPAGDDAGVDELSFATYGFRFGYRQTYVTTQPLKDKVAAIAAGGSDLSNNVAFWGDSLFEYPQHPTFSVSAQLATLLGVTTYNGGVSGQTMAQIKARFDIGSDKWGWITVFEAYNGFNDPNAYLTNLNAMILKLTPSFNQRWLILSCWNGDTQGIGTAGYNQIALLNKSLLAAYPNNYVDWRSHMILNGLNDAGITATSTDLTNIASDVIPASLRQAGDFLHGNDAAYGVAARQLAKVIRGRHWLSS